MLVKSPLNYMGGKYKLLPQILPLFPAEINTFVDLFAGGCNVGLNVTAQQIIFNDNLTYLIDLYQYLRSTPKEEIIAYLEGKIQELDLSQTNQEAYLKLRAEYNSQRKPIDLFLLSAYSFSHQIRFNNSHQFNAPFGKNRSSFNPKMKQNLLQFIDRLQQDNISLLNLSFEQVDFSALGENDLVYCDPPYLITTGTYNDGKRGFKGWSETEELQLLDLLDRLNAQQVRFALSNLLEHKGEQNQLLSAWIARNNYKVHDLNFNYNNSSYNLKNRELSSREVLITNY